VHRGKASTTCWAVHWAVGFEVTLKSTTLRRLWQRVTRTNKILKAIVGTVEKSINYLSVPTDNGIRLYNDKGCGPRMPNSEKQNPEEPIRHSNYRPLVCPFHDGQLLAKCNILSNKIRGDFDIRHKSETSIRSVFIMI
jgi:hypothetical protein